MRNLAVRTASGFVNGAVLGVRIRLPHALVTAAFVRRGPLRQRLSTVASLTATHAVLLGSSAALYRILESFLVVVGLAPPLVPLVSGGIVGHVVFGRGGVVATQIVLYVFSRVVLAALSLLFGSGAKAAFPVFSAAVWGAAMWLYTFNSGALPPALASSMAYIYDDRCDVLLAMISKVIQYA